MPRPSDARSARSQQALRLALLQLMEGTAFEALTLRGIVLEAEVSYPTFHRHYQAKEDLLADIARDEVVRFMYQPSALLGEAGDLSPGEQICRYVGERRALWRTVLTSGALRPGAGRARAAPQSPLSRRGHGRRHRQRPVRDPRLVAGPARGLPGRRAGADAGGPGDRPGDPPPAE